MKTAHRSIGKYAFFFSFLLLFTTTSFDGRAEEFGIQSVSATKTETGYAVEVRFLITHSDPVYNLVFEGFQCNGPTVDNLPTSYHSLYQNETIYDPDLRYPANVARYEYEPYVTLFEFYFDIETEHDSTSYYSGWLETNYIGVDFYFDVPEND